MDSVVRALLIYFFLLLVTRISGRRTLGEMTSFDFVLLLVIGEATQQALLGEDFSTMNAFVFLRRLQGNGNIQKPETDMPFQMPALIKKSFQNRKSAKIGAEVLGSNSSNSSASNP